MRVGVNLIPLKPGKMGGHEFYVRRLLSHLLKLEGGHQYFLFTAWWNDASIDVQHRHCRKINVVPEQESMSIPPGSLTQWLARYPFLGDLPLLRRWALTPARDLHEWVRRLGLDLWFCPMTNLDPRHLPIPTVVTIADIQQEYYPEYFTRAELRERALMYSPSCEEATAVITVSDFSKRCMIEKYHLPPEKVHLVYEAGIEQVGEPAARPTVEDVQRKYDLPLRYAFYPANMWPHKNHQLLLLALHRLRQLSGVTLSLVLTGDDLGQWAKVEALASHLRLQEHVRYLGYVPGEDLPSLYRGATMLLFPSLFEGFGIPLVEAMALGCPIVAANTASIPELVGDAALLCDPRDPDSIAAACSQLLADDEFRLILGARGQAQAARLSWERAAEETQQVFEWARAHHAAKPLAPSTQGARMEGVYPDGWAVRHVHLYLPPLPEVKALQLDGFSCNLSYPASLQMKVDGRQVQGLFIADAGQFTLVGRFPRPPRAMSGTHVEFIIRKDFNPSGIENSPDTRRLAYRIEGISLVCENGSAVSFYTPPLTS